MKKPISEQMAEKLSIEKEIMMDIPHLSISGNRELYIENYHSITEYTPEVIRIKTKDYTLKIDGIDLRLSFIDKEDIGISGIFAEISFLH